MKLEVSQLQGDGFNEVTAHHKGESLVWSTGTYGKVRLKNPTDVFAEINQYWEYAGEKVQDHVWNSYKAIKEIIDEMVDPFHVVKYLKEQIVILYQAMPMDDLSKWLMLRGNLFIPTDGSVPDAITEKGRHKNHDLTYIKEDYINLAVLGLALRPILPIWGEYIDQGGQGSGNDMYKEMEAMGLIVDTEIMSWPANNPAVEKLENYIRVPTAKTPVSLSSLWRGMGSAEIPIWLLSNAMVRRLTIVPLSDHELKVSIIAYIYRYICSKLKPADRRTSDRVNEKRPEAAGRDEDDKTSLLEEYKVKQRIADGDAMLYEVYSENMNSIAEHVDPTMDLKLINKTTQVMHRMEKAEISPHQVRLAQWVLAKAYSPRALYHINKVSVIRLLATAQALLWHWGFLDIACLMTVERISTTEQDAPSLTHRPRPSTRISRKYIDDLMVLYPHVKPQRGKDTNLRNGNVAALGINQITREIMSGNWHYLGPIELRKLAGQPEGRGLLVLPPNPKNNITELVIHLAQLNR